MTTMERIEKMRVSEWAVSPPGAEFSSKSISCSGTESLSFV
jgi:hypothetical protein